LKGDYKADNFLITHPEVWESIWKSVGKPVPEVNFRTHVIVGVVRYMGGDSLQDVYIDRIEKRKGGLIIWIRKQILQPGLIETTIEYGETASYVLIKRTFFPMIFTEEPYWIIEMDNPFFIDPDKSPELAPTEEFKKWGLSPKEFFNLE